MRIRSNGEVMNAILVLISISTVLVVTLGGSYLFLNYEDIFIGQSTSVNKTIVPEKPDEELKEIALSLDDEYVIPLSNIFSKNYLNSNDDRYSDYFYKNDKTVVSELPIDLKIWIILKELGLPDIVDENIVVSEYIKLYGTTKGYKVIDTFHNCESYKFEKGKYTKVNDDSKCVVNGSSNSQLAYVRNIFNSKTNIIDIYEYVYFMNVNGDGTYSYYSDYEKTKLVVTSEVDISETIFEDYSEKLGVYKYRFEENKDNYNFISVEKM